ncbi:MAG: PilZ domain-containing protein [Kiloniellales bacterium]
MQENHDHRERRKHRRAHVLFPARLGSGDRAAQGMIYDLSLGGLRIKLAEPFEAGSAITLRLAGMIDFHVEAAWEQNNVLGLKFRETPERIASIFAGLLPEACLAA